MKSKLFTYKIIIPVCIIFAALAAFSFWAHSSVVVPRLEKMSYQKEYESKSSADGQFLIGFAPDENNKKYGTISIFEGGYYGIQEAYVPSKYDDINITVIEEESFSEFDCLEKVIIPQSDITTIEKKAFKNTVNLKEIYIPSNVTDISSDAFYNCKNFTMYVEEGSYAEKFAVENNIKYEYYTPQPPEQKNTDYSKAKKGYHYNNFNYDVLYYKDEPFCAISYNPMGNDTDLKVPAYIDNIKVTTLSEYAFNDCSVETITLPDTVTTVCSGAFSCGSLTKVYFTKSVSYIDKSAFENSPDVVMCVPKDSYAYKYAIEHNIKFEEINN